MAKETAVFVLLTLFAVVATEAQEPVTVDWRVFSQFTAERSEGLRDEIQFGTERLRPRLAVAGGPWSGVIQLDFAARNSGTRPTGTLENVVLDVSGAYQFTDRHQVRIGQFKTPLGMDFNTSGYMLDITKRGMETGLTLNRDLGVMVSGNRIIGGWSYDIGMFNPPGRSQATQYQDSQLGQDSAQVVRLRFDDEQWHFEAAHGRAENAGGPQTSDYSVSDLALRYTRDDIVLKAEWIDGDHVFGDPTRSERVYYLHAGYRLKPKLELVARHYAGDSELGAATTELTNSYLGFTLALADYNRLQTRLQVNYVLAGGDELAYTGVRGFREDSLFLQLQLYVQK